MYKWIIKTQSILPKDSKPVDYTALGQPICVRTDMQVCTYVQPLNSRTIQDISAKKNNYMHNQNLHDSGEWSTPLSSNTHPSIASTINHIRTYQSIGTKFHHSTVQSSHVRSSILNAHFYTIHLCNNSTQTHIQTCVHTDVHISHSFAHTTQYSHACTHTH